MYPRIMQLRRLVVIQNKVKIPIKPIKISLSLSEGFQNGVTPCQVRGYCTTAVYYHGSQTEKKENPEPLLEGRAMSGAEGSYPVE